jgi:FkbM family methyltransferase
MTRTLVPLSFHVSPRRSAANAVRRRIWRWLYARALADLGSFYCDPRDHIGSERIIMGARYEGATLAVLDSVITGLGLGKGAALDVGANIGNHACWFAERFDNVLCVEPGKVASIVLEANLYARKIRNASVHRCALGSCEGAGFLDVVSEENLGSSVVRKCGGEGEFRILRGDDFVSEVAGGNAHIEVVKIDVEGGELEVVQGLTAVLAQYQPLVCVEVLDGERWCHLKESLTRVGYTSWYVIHADPDRNGMWSRLRTIWRGTSYRLITLPKVFRTGGYDMIFCMTELQRARIESVSR